MTTCESFASGATQARPTASYRAASASLPLRATPLSLDKPTSMSSASRAKGLRGEREVADAFERAGWTVRGYESGGDWLAVGHLGEIAPSHAAILLHVECK